MSLHSAICSVPQPQAGGEEESLCSLPMLVGLQAPMGPVGPAAPRSLPAGCVLPPVLPCLSPDLLFSRAALLCSLSPAQPGAE